MNTEFESIKMQVWDGMQRNRWDLILILKHEPLVRKTQICKSLENKVWDSIWPVRGQIWAYLNEQ